MAKRTGHGRQKLGNERFVANAKPEVVQKEKTNKPTTKPNTTQPKNGL